MEERMKMNRNIILILVVVIGAVFGVWSAGLWLGGCSSTQNEVLNGTTTTTGDVSTTTTNILASTTTTTTSTTTTTFIGSWIPLGGSFLVGSASFRMAVSPTDGLVYAIFLDQTDLKVKAALYFPGFNTWALLPPTGESVAETGSSYFNICAPGSGNLYAAYLYMITDITTSKVKVKNYNQPMGTWESFGTDVASGAAGSVGMQVYSDGINDVVYLSIRSGMGVCNIYKSDGGGWINLGRPSTNMENETMAIAKDGTPYIAYSDMNDNGKIKVTKYSSGNWVSQGGAISDYGPADYQIALKIHGNIAYIAFCEYSTATNEAWGPVRVKKYVSGIWKDVGSVADYGASLSLDVFDDGTGYGVPYIAYADQSNGFKLVVKMYNNNFDRWDQIGGYVSSYPASASLFPGYSVIRVVEAGRPIVSYHFTTNPDPLYWSKNDNAIVYKYQ